MIHANHIIDRVKEYFNIASDTELAKILDIKNTTISNWRTRNTVDFKLLFTKCEFANLNWIFTGEGEMLKSSEVNTPIVNYTSAGNPYYNVDFQGGFDILLNDQTILPEYYINFAPFNKSGAVWCNVSGKSMEPEISNGDKIVLREVKDWRTFLPMGEIYGIVTDEFRTIKRIRKSEIPEHLLLVPSNPAYDTQDIPIKKIRAVFQVLGSVKML